MTLFKREYTANTIDKDGNLTGCIIIAGRMNAVELMAEFKKYMQDNDIKDNYITSVRRLS